MSDKRQPVITFVLKKPGKKNYKIELFNATLWSKHVKGSPEGRYRLRINGRWFRYHTDEKYSFITRAEFWGKLEKTKF